MKRAIGLCSSPLVRSTLSISPKVLGVDPVGRADVLGFLNRKRSIHKAFAGSMGRPPPPLHCHPSVSVRWPPTMPRNSKCSDATKLLNRSTGTVTTIAALAAELAPKEQRSPKMMLSIVRSMASRIEAGQTRSLFGVRYERIGERRAAKAIPYEERFAALEARIAALESRDTLDVEGRGPPSA